MSEVSREEILQRVFSRGPKPGSGALDEIIAGLVFAQRPIAAAAREVLERYDLGPRGSFILSLIDYGVNYPLELASVLKIGRSLVTSELNRLIGAGLVEANPGQRDRRRSELSLTPAGKAASAAFRKRVFGMLKRNLAPYSDQEIELFARMLSDVRRTDGPRVEG